MAVAGRQREGVDQFVGRGEEGFVTVQDRLVGNRGGEMCLAAPGTALEHEAATLGGELGSEGGAEQQGAEFGLHGEVEFLEGVQDGEAGLAHAAAQAGLAAMLDLGAGEGGEEVAEGPGAALGLFDEFGVGVPGAGEMEALEHGLELLRGDVGRLHRGPRWRPLPNGSGSCSRANSRAMSATRQPGWPRWRSKEARRASSPYSWSSS